MGRATEKLQWHPAFFAGLQIEFEEESENLIFENEHQLGTKPKEIDEVTMSLVTHKYPRKLITHLKKTGHIVKREDAGIYYIEGFLFPIQLIHTVKLSEKENLWLRSLTNHLDRENIVEKIVKEYGRKQENTLYKSVMNIIVNANRKLFETEDGIMCEALMEIMKDKLDDARESGMKDGRKEEARLNALELLKNGVSFELVEKSITILTHEELLEIYDQVKHV